MSKTLIKVIVFILIVILLGYSLLLLWDEMDLLKC